MAGRTGLFPSQRTDTESTTAPLAANRINDTTPTQHPLQNTLFPFANTLNGLNHCLCKQILATALVQPRSTLTACGLIHHHSDVLFLLPIQSMQTRSQRAFATTKSLGTSPHQPQHQCTKNAALATLHYNTAQCTENAAAFTATHVAPVQPTPAHVQGHH